MQTIKCIVDQMVIIYFWTRSFLPLLLVTLYLHLSACSNPSVLNLHTHGIRLAQVWQSTRWLTTGAINRQGPIHIWLAQASELKALNLDEQAWIHPSVIKDLKLKTTRDLSGHRQTSLVSIQLDGLPNSIKQYLLIPNAAELKKFPQTIDMILPIETMVNTEHLSGDKGKNSESNQNLSPIIVQSNGYLGLVDHKKHQDSPMSYLNRFDASFKLNESYPQRLIAQRIDYLDHIEIEWFLPLQKLPENLWLVSSPHPMLESDSTRFNPQDLFIVRIQKPKATLLKGIHQYEHRSSLIKTYKLGEFKPYKSCTIQAPCPLYIYDVYRMSHKCLHDLCLIRKHLSR